MKANPYLNFAGNTKEAFDFYKKVFGGEFSMIQTFGDMPQDSGVSEEEKDLIMHVSLPVGDFILMGSDVPNHMREDFNIGKNVYVSLQPDSEAEGEKIFEALSEGGTVEMSYEKQFWGDYFGSCIDKFGIPWMINYHQE